jgi:hypothetical protein
MLRTRVAAALENQPLPRQPVHQLAVVQVALRLVAQPHTLLAAAADVTQNLLQLRHLQRYVVQILLVQLVVVLAHGDLLQALLKGLPAHRSGRLSALL